MKGTRICIFEFFWITASTNNQGRQTTHTVHEFGVAVVVRAFVDGFDLLVQYPEEGG